MSNSTIRDRWPEELVRFAWSQWAQLGVFAPSERADRWSIDPEALLLLTLEVGRNDPRLFDEVLDWLLQNERLISVQRLRNLCIDDVDRALVEGALAWVARHQPRSRARWSQRGAGKAGETQLLFRGLRRPVSNPDPAFLAHGFLKPETEPSGKSRPPDVDRPAAFAFRLRLLFGVGSRPEVVRYLLTTPAPDVPAQLVTEAVGFAKRNINETLGALTAAKIVVAFEVANEHRYYIDRAQWGQLLRLTPETWPEHRDWIQLFRALRQLTRFMASSDAESRSSYLGASRARDTAERIAQDLRFVGVDVGTALTGADYWRSFDAILERTLSRLG